MLTTLCGYCVIGLLLVVLHAFTALLNLRRFARMLGLCYVVVKVALLLVIEIVAFPVICGWWLDICSLALFDASLKVEIYQSLGGESDFKSYFVYRTVKPVITTLRWRQSSSIGSSEWFTSSTLPPL